MSCRHWQLIVQPSDSTGEHIAATSTRQCSRKKKVKLIVWGEHELNRRCDYDCAPSITSAKGAIRVVLKVSSVELE
jgi:hypothetical protein